MACCRGARLASFSSTSGKGAASSTATRRVLAEFSSDLTASGSSERITVSIPQP